ncbi:MAG: T9SS type A sorting domain-containing protein [Bacteroidales bacterium]|nr:T9SS type A sorting domain-containing protein [Bacteroidales bacterium]
MKKFILIFAMAISMSIVFGQTATLRLQMPATPPAIGEQFLVGVYLDELVWPVDPTIWSAIFGFNYDPAVLTAVSTGPPFNRWYHNHSQMFIDYGSLPSSNVPAAGDLRIFFGTGAAYGFDPSFYGFESGVTPFKFFDLKFTYLGGDIEITWQNDNPVLEPAPGGLAGGKLLSVETEMSAPPPPAVGVFYVLTTIDITTGGGIDYMWVGGTPGFETDWFTATNWLPVGVPTEADNVEFPGTKAGPCILSGSATVTNLLISGGSLTIADMSDLTVNGTFQNDGTFVIASNGIAVPGGGESGSFIDMMGVSGTGIFEFQRDITNSTPLGSQVGWHFISSPLPAGEFTSNDLIQFYLNRWDPIAQLYSPVVGAVPCVPAPPVANGLMEGWSIKHDQLFPAYCAVPVDPVINMIGTSFNSGPQGPFALFPGWNLAGNPYPSAINPDFIAYPAGLTTNTVYMWDGWSSSTWVLGFVGSGLNIPPAQGFFVEASASDNLNFLGTTGVGGERIHDPFQWWWKDASDFLKLQVTVEGRTNADFTYIRFNDVSTPGLDKEWDANKLYAGIDATPQIWTMSEGLELALNTQPAVDMVPMSFSCGTAGTYTIEAIETGTFENVVLEDLVTYEQTDLLSGSYTFEYSDVNEVHPFMVHFTPLGTIEYEANSIRIWASDNQVNVVVPNTGTIVVYNMMGQEVTSKDADPGLNTLPVNDVNTYYIVQVVTESNAKTGKVFIK